MQQLPHLPRLYHTSRHEVWQALMAMASASNGPPPHLPYPLAHIAKVHWIRAYIGESGPAFRYGRCGWAVRYPSHWSKKRLPIGDSQDGYQRLERETFPHNRHHHATAATPVGNWNARRPSLAIPVHVDA
jgi:hypothetical protein